MTPEYQTSTVHWQGIAIEISYAANWLGGGYTAHLEIRSMPERTPLPMTETGYRSHFLSMGVVEDMGDAETYVRAWLEQDAAKLEWRNRQEQSRQMSLF